MKQMKLSFRFMLTCLIVCITMSLKAQFGTSPWTATTGSYTVPIGVTSITIQSWGGGGGGGGASAASCSWADGGGGGGGAYSTATVAVTPLQTISIIIGTGGAAGSSGGGAGGNGVTSMVVNTTTSTTLCSATGGNGGGGATGAGATGAGGSGGASGVGFLNNGGNGGSPYTYYVSGGGGGGAGTTGAGGNGNVPGGGAAGSGGGGNGGAGHTLGADGTIAGSAGSFPSGGGGGGVGSFTIGCGGGYGVGGGAGAAGKIIITYTVNIPPCAGVPSPGTATANPTSHACSGNSVISLTGYTTDLGITHQWFSSTDNINFSIISGATSLTYSSPILTTTTYYYCVSTCTNSGLADTSNVVTITINTTPPSGTANCNPNTVSCSGASIIFLGGYSTDPGITFQWYSSTDNINFSIVSGATTTSYTSPVLTTTTYFYCISTCTGSGQTATSTTTTLTVVSAPATPGTITSNGSHCEGTGVTFTQGSCTSGTCYWVSSATGTQTSNSANTYTTPTTAGTYTVWVRAYNGSCWSAAVTATGIVSAAPPAPTVASIIQPTCTLATGSVVLTGLPPTGSWTIERTPGGVISAGVGTSATVTGLPAGTYTYTVTNSTGCTSTVTVNIVINPQPPTPTAPLLGAVIQPTCTVATGSVTLNGLPLTGNWIVNPGNISGSGATITITGLNAGNYYYTVTNSFGCTSQAAPLVAINPQPITPTAPTVGTIIQPTCITPTGSVSLNGLPLSGNWTINPGNITGSGAIKLVTGLTPGSYTFTVVIGTGCISPPSATVTINAQPATPTAPTIGTITQPTCTVGTGSVVLLGLPSSGSWVINPGNMSGTGTSITLTGLTPGTNAFTVTNSAGCTSAASSVVINPQPATPPTPVITQVGGVLYSSAATGNQWYNQSGVIGGATNQTFTITVNGDYYVIVNLGGCPSDTSNILYVTNAGVAFNELAQSFSVFPNPMANELNILVNDNKDVLSLEIINAIGEVVYKNKLTDKLVISTENFVPGIYIIKLMNDEKVIYKKIVK